MRVGLLFALAACSFDARSARSDAPQDSSIDAVDASGSAACGVAEIAAGGSHTCARRFDGTVACWGNDNTYELGAVTTTKCNVGGTMYMCSPTPLAVAIDGAVALGLGTQHTCAATSAGTYCWGYDKYGAFGDGTVATSGTPHLVAQRAGATAIAGGVYHTCSVSAGSVDCSGENVAGEVGNNTMTLQTTAVSVMTSATSITAGEYLSCALDGQQAPWCWGHNNFYEIDTTTAQNELVPTPLRDLPAATSIAAGRDHLCAVAPDHTVFCRGSNTFGQINAAVITNAQVVSAGHNHTCIIDMTGAVSCIGEVYGAAPAPIPLPHKAIAITSGTYHDCALVDDHSAYCWGDDSFGELGDGTPSATRATTPVKVPLCP